MIHKSFQCQIPATNRFAASEVYQVHAWAAPGTDTVNLRVQDSIGFGPVESHSKKRYKVGSLEEMVDYLFYKLP